MLSIISLTAVFLALYYVSTHQQLYFGRELLFVDTQTLAAIYVLLLTSIVLRGRLKVFRSFSIAIALYFAARLAIFNISHYYPVYISSEYVLLFLISAALIAVELPKRHIFNSAGFAIAALSLYMLLEGFNKNLAFFTSALCGLISISALSTGFDNWIARGIVRSRGYAILALAGFAIISFAKPHLKGGLFDFAEWLLLLFLSISVAKNIRFEADEYRLEEHKPEISTRGDELATSIESASKAFVESGEKSELIALIAKVLSDAGIEAQKIAEVIEPIAHHIDERVPRFSFSWERRLVEGRNRRRREKIMEKTISRLRGWYDAGRVQKEV